MENAMALAAILGPTYLVLSLSVLLYADTWQKILQNWRKDHLPLIPLMLMMVVLGMIMVRMYNVWEWNVWLLVTLIGWIVLLKGVLYFLLPASVLKSMMDIRSKGVLYLGGVVGVVVGAVLSYSVYWM